MNTIATVMIAKCSKSLKDFGVRWEQGISEEWIATWAFKIKDTKAKTVTITNKSGALNGTWSMIRYPGCPYCGEHELVLCLKCHQTFCHDWHKKPELRCPWCGESLMITEKPSDAITSTCRDA